MNEIINVGTQIKYNNSDSNIVRIQRNLMMMEFDIEMINKIILYFNIETENQAIDYLTKNSDGMWGHPFIPKINEEINNDKNENEQNNNDINSSHIIGEMKTKINTIKNKGISNIIYYPMEEEDINQKKELFCEICGESEKYHIDKNNNINNINNLNNERNNDIKIKEELIEDSKYEDKHTGSGLNDSNENKEDNNNINNILYNNNIDNHYNNINENNNKECPICLCDIENKVELEDCHHKYCRECFSNYLIDLINKNNIDKIPCPIKTCFNKEIKEDFFNKFLTEEQYFKYRTFRSQNAISRDPKKMFCPLCDGYALIEINSKYKYDPNDPKYIKSTITCINGHDFCSCGIALHEGECYKDTNDFQKYLINEHVKQCPKCGFYIKKLKGCNHMTCGNALCKYEFCWLCMKEAVPGHFEYGQCKGMQFINPNSFLFKLKRNHPWIYHIVIILRAIFNILLLLFIFFVFPSIILIIALLFLLANRNFPFKHFFRIVNNRFFRLVYFITVSLIIISLQNIEHLLIGCLIVFIILVFIISILCRFVKIIYKSTLYIRSRIRSNQN